jgi:hypothetical protein
MQDLTQLECLMSQIHFFQRAPNLRHLRLKTIAGTRMFSSFNKEGPITTKALIRSLANFGAIMSGIEVLSLDKAVFDATLMGALTGYFPSLTSLHINGVGHALGEELELRVS